MTNNLKKTIRYGVGAAILGNTLSDPNVPTTVRTVALGAYTLEGAHALLPEERKRRNHYGR